MVSSYLSLLILWGLREVNGSVALHHRQMARSPRE